MRSLLQKLLNLQNKSTQETEREDLSNSLSLILMPDISFPPQIRLDINDTSTDAAQRFATSMIALNSAQYCADIVQLLMELSERTPELNAFVQVVLSTWKHYLNHQEINGNDNNIPLIKPSAFTSLK